MGFLFLSFNSHWIEVLLSLFPTVRGILFSQKKISAVFSCAAPLCHEQAMDVDHERQTRHKDANG